MTYPFGNVNIGSYPDDGTGDPLRNAFNTINTNFANIANGSATVYAPVQSVAGRTGNVTLSINDISGAASFAYVAAGVASANAYTNSQIAIVNSNIASLETTITANVTANVIANINLTGTNANIAAANVAIAQLQANDVTQNSSLSSLNSSIVTVQNSLNANSANITLLQSGATATNAAIVSANTAMKAYVDANASAQSNSIAGANAAIQTLSANVGGFYTWANAHFSTNTYSNSNVTAYLASGTDATITAINLAITHNASNITSLQSNSATQFTWLNNLTTTTTSIENSVVSLQNSQSNDEANIRLLQLGATATNAAIVSANTAMKSYVDANATVQLSQITGANAAIQTLSANVGGFYTWANTNLAGTYSNTNVAAYLSANTDSTISRLNANTVQQQTQIISINSNVTAANSAISTLQSSVGSIQTSLVSLQNTQSSDEANIRLLQANLTVGPITISGNVTGNYIKGNGSYLTNVTGNIHFSGANISSTTGQVSIINDTVMTGNLVLGNVSTSIHNILGNVVFGPAIDIVASADSIITVNPTSHTPLTSNNTVHVQGYDGRSVAIGGDTFGNTNVTSGGSLFIGRRARGTGDSPSAVQQGDVLATFMGRGYGTSGFKQGATSPSLQFIADENYTDTAQGTYATVNVTNIGSNIARSVMIFDSSGNIVIAGTTTSGNVTTGALVVKGGAGFAGNVNVGGNVSATIVKTTPTTVSSLPTAASVGAGARSFVTDANTTTFNSAVSGSGGNAMPVFSDGTSWRIG